LPSSETPSLKYIVETRFSSLHNDPITKTAILFSITQGSTLTLTTDSFRCLKKLEKLG